MVFSSKRAQTLFGKSAAKPFDQAAQPAAPVPAVASPLPESDPHLYDKNDPLPVPQALEHSSDTTWALFADLQEQTDRGFADTQPPEGSMLMPMDQSAPYAATVPAVFGDVPFPEEMAPQRSHPKRVSLEDVIAIGRQKNRVCPQPAAWGRLYSLLVSLPASSGLGAPPPPLLAQAWKQTPFLAKRMAFRAQIEWADATGHLEKVRQFLLDMPDSEWHHNE